MRKITLTAISALAVLCLSSCEPQGFTMNMEMRHPSSSGIDLSGKSISVVYMDDLSGRDTVFNANVANGFASALESDYFGGNQVIDVYTMVKDMSGKYFEKDTLVNLIMDSGDDVVFLFDSPEFGDISLSDRQIVAGNSSDSSNLVYATIPYRLNLYTYDSMGNDSVRVFRGASSMRTPIFCGRNETDDHIKARVWDNLSSQGELTGKKAANTFLSTWKEEQFTMIYYDSPEAWVKAAQAAYEYKFHDAIDIWMSLLDTKNMEKRACAEYNIATVCYLMGDYGLAEKWLDRSDKDNIISLSRGLRAKINAKKK